MNQKSFKNTWALKRTQTGWKNTLRQTQGTQKMVPLTAKLTVSAHFRGFLI
jgi:hypothetical protein